MAATSTNMGDEYGALTGDGKICPMSDFQLESGRILKKVEVCYKTWGCLNETADNAIVICHALTGNADAGAWWGQLIGNSKAVDTRKYFVFCSNVLGGCYGTTGPTSINPDTGKKYGKDFPKVTIRDMVRLQAECLQQVGVRGVVAVIGGSMGGMQALEWGLEISDLKVGAIASLCASGRHQAWQIGISECQRQAIKSDPNWQNGDYDEDKPPSTGLGVARMMAMVNYRAHPAYATKFGRGISSSHQKRVFEVESYLHYQGQKFIERGFDAASYIVLTHAMDSHDVERGRGSYFDVLRGLRLPVLLVSISSDVLYPMSEQLELDEHIPCSQHHLIQSDEGHDGFLLEHVKVGTLLRGFLAEIDVGRQVVFEICD
mmetsp:Transcript_63426/g.112744  ORF Transcript_63426/g.112744 Transcript_63426/m.112744 type:complete len:374 (+) Transcript_63426:36-1157(+)